MHALCTFFKRMQLNLAKLPQLNYSSQTQTERILPTWILWWISSRTLNKCCFILVLLRQTFENIEIIWYTKIVTFLFELYFVHANSFKACNKTQRSSLVSSRGLSYITATIQSGSNVQGLMCRVVCRHSLLLSSLLVQLQTHPCLVPFQIVAFNIVSIRTCIHSRNRTMLGGRKAETLTVIAVDNYYTRSLDIHTT